MSSERGRQCPGVLGAVETRNHDFVSIWPFSAVNAEIVRELLEKLNATYPGEEITLVIENAGYQRSRFVIEMADALAWGSFTLQSIPPTLISLNVSGVSSKPHARETNTSGTSRCLPPPSMSLLIAEWK